MRPGDTRGRSRRTGRGTAPWARLLVTAALVATPVACSSPASHAPSAAPTVPASAARGTGALLVVLDVTRGRTAIAGYAADGAPSAITPPSGEVQWLAADSRGRLVATRVDGGIVRATGPALADPDWLDLGSAPTAGSPPRSFGVPDPTGETIAALVAAYGSGGLSSLAILRDASHVAAGPSAIATGVEANGAAPAWLDDRRVVVCGLTSRGTPGTVIVDTATGATSPGPAGVRASATSTDGRWIAVVRADQRTIDVEETARWLANGAGAIPSRSVPAELGGVVVALALDTSGRSLAVVWTGPDLVPAAVVRYEDTGAWRERGRIVLRPGTTRAAVAWVPASTGASP